MEINDILLEWSYRLKKGYPTMEDGKFTEPSELKVLHEILKENGISEIPSFVKSKTPVSDEIIQTLNENKTKKDIYQLVDKMNLEPEQEQKLYDRIKTFVTYRPIKQVLLARDFDPAEVKKYTSELQTLIEDLPESEVTPFVNYIQGKTPDGSQERERVLFPDQPTKVGGGKLISDIQGDFQAVPKTLSKEVVKAIASHKGIDKGSKGVGQSELMLALVFDNIKKPSKGDLELLNDSGESLGEFEIKSGSARLGATGPASTIQKLSSMTLEKLAKLGIKFPENKLTYKGKKVNLSAISLVLAMAAKEDEDAVIDAFISILVDSGVGQGNAEDAANLEGMDWTDSNDVNRAFGLANFLRYARVEKFTAFAAFDYGAGGQSQGQYYFAKGSALDMANQLLSAKVNFEKASITSPTWPRIQVPGKQLTTTLSEEELDY